MQLRSCVLCSLTTLEVSLTLFRHTHLYTHTHTHTRTDALDLRTMVGSFIVLAEFERMRDMVAGALPFWSEEMPLYHCILAL